MEVSPAPWDHNYCRISSKLHEREGRLAVKKLKRPFRVETPSTSISENLPDQRKTRGESFCFSTISTASTEHCMETRSIQSGNGCNAANLVQSVPSCFPTFFNDKQGLKKDRPGSNEKNVDCNSHMAVSGMVPNPSENVNRETTSFATPPTSSIKLPGSDTSINNKQNIKISGLDGFRQRLLATGISERASKVISSTRRRGLLSNYNSSWSKWASWCGERKLDPFRCAIGKVLDYLSYLFHLGCEYRTVGCYRSAISAYHEYGYNKPVSQHPHVCALLKGVFNERPPQPRYVFIWDIQTVLYFVKCHWSGCDSSDKVLTYKLIILMAL